MTQAIRILNPLSGPGEAAADGAFNRDYHTARLMTKSGGVMDFDLPAPGRARRGMAA